MKQSIFDSTFNLINECKKYKFNIFINTAQFRIWVQEKKMRKMIFLF